VRLHLLQLLLKLLCRLNRKNRLVNGHTLPLPVIAFPFDESIIGRRLGRRRLSFFRLDVGRGRARTLEALLRRFFVRNGLTLQRLYSALIGFGYSIRIAFSLPWIRSQAGQEQVKPLVNIQGLVRTDRSESIGKRPIILRIR